MISTIVATIVTFSSNASDFTTATASEPTSTSIYNYSYIDVSNTSNNTTFENDTYNPVLPGYIRITSMVFCIIIMCLGVIGNIMVPIVIFKTKDMRNSTNIFLVNLSVADLMVLLVCTPTVLVEVNSRPEVWVLGEEMCKAVPFVELTVAHASVLTILAISFERYYAICKPLKAGYICTKARASLICLLAWFAAAIFTSPILAITQYNVVEYFDRSMVPVCFSMVETLLPSLYFIVSMLIFFFFPLFVLVVLYALIAKTLMDHPNLVTHCKDSIMPSECVIKYRKQVVLMLGTVVFAFFVCLLPFRAFTLWIIIMPANTIFSIGLESYYNLLYFCRIMFHINSAINPILYNVMSSKFRNGFLRICGIRYFHVVYKNKYINRRNTFNTSSTNTSTQHTADSFLNRYSKSQLRHPYAARETSSNLECKKQITKPEGEVYFRIPSGTSVLNKEDKQLIFNESFV